MPEPRNYMREIADQAFARGLVEKERQKAEASLAEYEKELEALTLQLQKKHGYSALVEQLNKANENIAAIDYQTYRNSVQMVVALFVKALRANPEIAQGTCRSLEKRWGIETSRNINVSDECFLSCFNKLAEAVCDNDWWDKQRPVQQGNGFTWLEKPKNFDWEPIVSIGIPGSLLTNLEMFKREMETIIVNESKDWAIKWVGDTASDMDKQRALYEELKRFFDGPDS